MDFPHLNDSQFPNVGNVDVYKYANEFDYSRYDTVQMRLTLCKVPWDMGEAHVGQRTISGIGNVVYFGSKERRDAWFRDILDKDCFRWESKYKSLQKDNQIVVPVPFDVASRFNYLAVEYAQFANDGSPVQYEDPNGHRRWFWFVREVEFLSPNSTMLYLLPDAWQTWIYDVTIPYMVLERGHAPLKASPLPDYLADPVHNSRYLLADDVNFGESPNIARHESEFLIDGKNTYAVIVTTANPNGSWGTKAGNTWTTPDGGFYNQGVTAYYNLACASANLATLLTTINTNIPQFFATVKGIFFIDKSLVSISSTITFQGVTCYVLTSSYVTNGLYTLNADDFGYPSRYRNLTKLYTYPYSVIEIYNADGSMAEVRIEDTTGKLQVECALNLVWPWIKLNGHVKGIGTAPARTLTFTHISARTAQAAGNWLDYLVDLDIPIFGVTQASSDYDDWNTHYQRLQMANEVATAYANAQRNIACDQANVGEQKSANTDVVALANAKAADDVDTNNTYNITTKNVDNLFTAGSTIINNSSDQVSASIAQSKSVVDGLLSGNIGSAISGIVNTGYIAADTSVAVNLRTSQGTAQNNYNDTKVLLGNGLASALLALATAFETDKKNRINTQLTNELANRVTRDSGNATANQTLGNAAIDNLRAQNSLMSPLEFGDVSAGESAVNRPRGLFAVVKTQSESAIAQAGDAFLRYGYAYNGVWEFDGNWNVMPKYTYWKLSDFWVEGLEVPDLYMDRLRFFLFGGVTVWKVPEDIGRTMITDNGV